MKRTLSLLLAVVVALLLAACRSDLLDDAYTASGNGTLPSELIETTDFQYNDDLNVVITLSEHNRDLLVQAVFVAPTSATYATDPLMAGKTVGQVVLGLDWAMMGGQDWPVGQWKVDVYVAEPDGDGALELNDSTKRKTLKFKVWPREEDAEG